METAATSQVDQRQALVHRTMGRAMWRYRKLGATAWLRGPARQSASLNQAHVATASEMARTIASVGGLYIKVGQLVSVAGAWLPSPFRDALAGLQDSVAGRDVAGIKARIEAELGAPMATLFASFDDKPMASASIGQVHRAVMHDGTQVAVKVQHQGLEQTVAADLATLSWIFETLARRYPGAGFVEMFAEIRALVTQELDFVAEAAHVATFARQFEGREDVVVPCVIASHSSARVLTLTYQDGRRVTEHAELGLDGGDVARQLVALYCDQVFGNGTYHADPHPGNVLVRAHAGQPQLVLLDFGAVAHLSAETRQGILRLLHGVITYDTELVVHSLRTLGFVAKHAEGNEATDRALRRVVTRLHQHLQAQLETTSATVRQMLQDPTQLLARIGDGPAMGLAWREVLAVFQVPREFIALERTLLLLFGVCRQLDPTLRPMSLIGPHVQHYLVGNARDVTSALGDLSKDYVMNLLALPGQMKGLIEEVEQLRSAQRDARLAQRRNQHMLQQAVFLGLATVGGAGAIALNAIGQAGAAMALGVGAAFAVMGALFHGVRAWHTK